MVYRQSLELIRVGFIAAIAPVVGCRSAPICEPPGSVAGVFTRVRNSDAYIQLIQQAESDVPHVGCRADGIVAVHRLIWQQTEINGQNYSLPSGGSMGGGNDPRITLGTKNTHQAHGYFRIYGVGRGLDENDCAAAALAACDEEIDRYWRREGAVRPISTPCVIADANDRCPGPGGSFEPIALEPPARSEPPLVTLIKKLDDPKTRRDAVLGLEQFFENAKTRAHGDAADPGVKALLDRIVEPLAKTYAEADLDDTTRVKLIRFLGESRDPRAGRAWTKACASFSSGKPGTEEDVEWAALGIAATRHDESAAALGEAFTKLDADKPHGAEAQKSVRDAMLALKSPAWKSMLIERIRRPMAKETEQSSAHRNERFWQTTAAEVLGELGAADAVMPLLDVVVDPDKAEVAPAAARAIVRIGKEAVPVLIQVLAGASVGVHGAAAANALGEIGSAEAREPMVKALKAADGDASRAAIAKQLPRLPASADAKKAFQTAYGKLAPGATIALSGAPARPALLDAAAGFYDPALVPWLLAQVKAAKGTDAAEVRVAGLRAAMKLMKRAQVAQVTAAVDAMGTAATKDAARVAAKVAQDCDVAVDCHLAKLAEPGAGFASVKAAYMLGSAGNAKTGAAIAERIGALDNVDARWAALAAVDHLVWENAAAVADSLEKLEARGISEEEKTSIRQVALRLRAR
jgi:hypothetical protein